MTEQRANWPQIGDIVCNHEGGRPGPDAGLNGQEFDWILDNGEFLSLRFGSDGVLQWTVQDIPLTARCEVFRVRPGLFFVDCVETERPNYSHSWVLDLAHLRLLYIEVLAPAPDAPPGLLERLAQRGSQSAVDLRIRQAVGVGAAETKIPAFLRSTALVGQHLRYRYSSTHLYDHIYLSDRYYCWFCHRGPDAGLGDFEECDVFELGPSLYFVCWKEKLIPCAGVTIEDLHAMRSIGKIFGADAYTGIPQNRTVGAEISSVSTFVLP